MSTAAVDLPPAPSSGSSPRSHGDRRSGRRYWLIAALLLLAAVALQVAHAVTKIPHVDEGDLASAGVSLLERGKIAFPMSWIYPASIRDHYFSAPFYYWVLAAWFKVAGSSLAAYRLLHTLFFVLLVAGWTRVVTGASRTAIALPVAVATIAFSYDLLNLGISRYDVVVAALNAAAMGAYVHLRERRLVAACFAANALLACSATTHPYAIFGLVGCVTLVLATGDIRRIRLVHVAAGLAPYVVLFGAWALTITDYATFDEQRRFMTWNKWTSLSTPLATLLTDFRIRWWELFAGWRDGVPVVMRAKTGFFALWLLALVLVPTRGDAGTRGIRWALVAYSLVALLLMPYVDVGHLQIYSIHAIGGLMALTAVLLADLADRAGVPRLAALAAAGGIALFGVVSIGFRVRQNDVAREYRPVVEAVRQELRSGGYVIAPPTLGFELDYWRNVRSDDFLKSIRSGPMPAVLVESEERGFGPARREVGCEPGAAPDSAEYTVLPVATPRQYYRVYRRSGGAAPGDSTGRLRLVRRCGA